MRLGAGMGASCVILTVPVTLRIDGLLFVCLTGEKQRDALSSARHHPRTAAQAPLG